MAGSRHTGQKRLVGLRGVDFAVLPRRRARELQDSRRPLPGGRLGSRVIDPVAEVAFSHGKLLPSQVGQATRVDGVGGRCIMTLRGGKAAGACPGLPGSSSSFPRSVGPSSSFHVVDRG